MSDEPLLIVANRIGLHGETGVQHHCQMILRHAPAWGKRVFFISPWERPRFSRRLVKLMSMAVAPVRPDLPFFFGQWAFDRILRYRAVGLLRRFGSDRAVLYAQDPSTATALLQLRRRWPSVRVVLCAHYAVSESSEHIERGLAEPGDKRTQRLDFVEGEALLRCDAVIFPSEFSRQMAISRVGLGDSNQLHVVPHVVEGDENATSDRASSQLVSNRPDNGCLEDELRRPHLITIGTLEPRKNQAFLIRLVAELIRHGFDAHLTLVGDGPSRQELARLANELNVSSRIHFAGLVLPAAPLIKDHVMLVHSSRMESFGIVLVEALSRGRPIGAPPVGAIPEIIRDGIEGVHLDLDDIGQSALLLAELFADAERYRRMCAAALERYYDAFRPDKVLPRWRDAIG